MANENCNGYTGGPLPERWLKCPRKARCLLMNKFLAFKAPLDSKFDNQIPLQYRFTPEMFLDSVKSHKMKLALWIDLTKTSRFYDKNEITDAGICYAKLECAGHSEAPTFDQTNTFINLCENFITRHPLDIIGVHCTHGFNRTGFLLISYMVEKMDCSLEAAIREFATVRPPGIYKEDYIRELYRRYDDECDAPPAPPLPDWCYDELNGTAEDNCAHDRKSKNFNKKKYKENPIFMEGVPGVKAITDHSIIDKIHLKAKDLSGYNCNGFPGSQPVSMIKSNVNFLTEKQYRVSWKADGTRYMMLICGEGEVYFLDRDNSVFQVDKLQFYNRKTGQHLANTLLDGEMVIDKYRNMNIPRYLIYDMVNFEGNKIGDQPFYPTRMQVIDVEIIQPRIAAMKEGRIIKNKEPFSVRAKAFYDITMSAYLLSEKFSRQLTHEPDGLIFQPSIDPYKCGQTPEVLKWKPLGMNSIDFLLHVEKETREGYANQFVGRLLSGAGKEKTYFGEIKCTKAVRALHGKIIECKYENNQWVLMRERTDKSFPNSYETAKAVYSSIRDPVTKEFLLEYIDHHRWRDPMPPPLAPPPVKRPRTM